MRKILIFAVHARDALAKCEELGVAFENVVWVMNYQLLGGADFSGHEVYYTNAFTLVPAYGEAFTNLGNGTLSV